MFKIGFIWNSISKYIFFFNQIAHINSKAKYTTNYNSIGTTDINCATYLILAKYWQVLKEYLFVT